MKLYLLSLSAGVLVGVVYALLGVRSPAPPVVALVGLLGILAGEQLVPLAINLWKREVSSAWTEHVIPHVFGELPKATKPVRKAKTIETADSG
ncbi:MAG: XapX domain-containing protein [Rhizobium sp.]|uniref:XapX domain-containing protein n=1 Tax=Rhizobium sp. TaxID=391 RepID=UPI00389A48BD